MSALTLRTTSAMSRIFSAAPMARFAPALAALPGVGALIGGISSLLELLPPIVLAVPKHKVTHSRKSMRSAHKGIKNKTSESGFGVDTVGGRKGSRESGSDARKIRR